MVIAPFTRSWRQNRCASNYERRDPCTEVRHRSTDHWGWIIPRWSLHRNYRSPYNGRASRGHASSRWPVRRGYSGRRAEVPLEVAEFHAEPREVGGTEGPATHRKTG